MTTPDPAFLEFFANDFKRLLDDVAIPGMAEPSWDRRAAWLLWTGGMRHTLPAEEPPSLLKGLQNVKGSAAKRIEKASNDAYDEAGAEGVYRQSKDWFDL